MYTIPITTHRLDLQYPDLPHIAKIHIIPYMWYKHKLI